MKRIPERIEKISTRWYTQAPFLSEFLLRLSYVKNESLTMGVTFNPQTKAITLLYSTWFMDQLDEKQLEGVLVHEISHLLLLSAQRKGDRNAQLFNVSSDIVINCDIVNNWTIQGHKLELPLTWVLPSGEKAEACTIDILKERGYQGKLIAEDIYEFLKEKEEDKGKDGESKDKDSEKGEEWQTIDNHDGLSELEEEALEVIEDIKNAAKVRGFGNVSGNLEAYIKELLRPERIPIGKFLRQKISYVLGSSSSNKTWKKINRRRLPLQGKQFLSNEINVFVDVSGSCYDEQTLKKFFSEIDFFAKRYQVNLIQFDTEIKSISKYKKNDWKKIKFNAGGGTCIEGIVEHMKKSKNKNNIVLTDGEFSWNINHSGINPLFILTQEMNIPWGLKFVFREI